MAFITPTNNVKLLTGIPINNDYENTLKFASRSAQYTYFSGKVKNIGTTLVPVYASWANISYQRYSRNSIKLEVNAEKLYDCNYMMFQNTNFGDKWFYAFITEILYIANEVTEIFYEIDVMQTWFPDCTLRPSFVEREHRQIDGVGVNRVEEGIDYGEYYLRSLQPCMYAANHPMFEESVIVVAVDKADSHYTSNLLFRVYSGIGSGLWYFVFPNTAGTGLNYGGIDGVNAIIQMYTEATQDIGIDNIISIFMCPKIFFVDYSTQPTNINIGTYGSFPMYLDSRAKKTDVRSFDYTIKIPDAIGSYTPRNKKLLQYPYNFLMVTDCKNENATYKYEDFVPVTVNNESHLKFTYYTQPSTDSSMMIVPNNYRGLDGKNYAEKMVFKGFPICSWSCDMWQAYIAQNGGVLPTIASDVIYPSVDMLSSTGYIPQHFKDVAEDLALGMLGVETVKDKERARMGTQGNITNTSVMSRTLATFGRTLGHTKVGNQARGNYNGDVMFAAGLTDFQYGQMTITAEFVARLDKFFDLYGYKTNEVKIPNTNVRKHWTYTKVIGLNMIASIPQDAEEKIKAIFENGIRFWNYPDEVGNFSDSLCEDNIAENTRPVTP